jgi:oxalate decarboxylase/phosphoglucose isomerase-like protein (cupin superfamily)
LSIRERRPESITNPVEEKQMEVKGKVFRGEDFLKINNPNPGQAYRLDILTDKEGAKNLGGLFGIRPVPVPGEKPALHYHQNRESIIVILTGEGEELLDGEVIPVKAGDVIYIRPLAKHVLVNKGQTEMKFIEFFTHPPVRSDFIEVK